MSRINSLLRLQRQLVSKRNDLCRKISDDLGEAHAPDDGINDIAETANLVEQSELQTQLAALESVELAQIDHAIGLMRAGRYGLCEACERPIPIARLEALPFTNCCIECQRASEHAGPARSSRIDWSSVVDYERRSVVEEPALSDFAAE